MNVLRPNQTSNCSPQRFARRGFSLLEILLALAILGGSMAVLSQIVDTGVSAAREARDLSVVQILCQTKMSQILLDATAGISPTATSGEELESFDSQSTTKFECDVEVAQAALDGLLAIRVTVQALDPNDGPPLAQYSLTRWMIDPLLGLEEMEMEEELAKEQTAGGET